MRDNKVMNKVKMSDIAKAMNISTVTVSKALADKDGVSEKLRAEIKEKAKELGYVYNRLPLLMREGITYNIGILISERFLGAYSFYWEFYHKLQLLLQKTQYSGLLEIVTADREKECAMPEFIDGNKVDGLIVLGQFSLPYLEEIVKKNKPYVFLDFALDVGGKNSDCVITNNFYGSYTVTNYLIGKGHREIVFVGSLETTSILDRYLGYLRSMMEHKLAYYPPVADRDAEGKYIGIQLPERKATAYVCNNDRVASMLIRTLTEKGFRVPEDVSVTGFDNSEELVDGIGITTMAVDVEKMCEVAVELILKKITTSAEVERGRNLVECKLVQKQSVAVRA